jgi:S-methylmethionine-dependent homocysteine/selenocysteine methylase
MEMEISGKKITFTPTWLNMDDATLGKTVKSTALMLLSRYKEDAVAMQSIAVLLVNCAHRSHTKKITLNVAMKEGEKYEIKVSKIS